MVGSLLGGALVDVAAGTVRGGGLVTAVGAVFVALTAGSLFGALSLSGGATCALAQIPAHSSVSRMKFGGETVFTVFLRLWREPWPPGWLNLSSRDS